MRPVAPRTGAEEITVAEDQHEYVPLVVALHADPGGSGSPVLLTRWRLSEEERAAIAAGEDLYVGCLTFGERLQPLLVTVGDPKLPIIEVEE